MTEFWVSNERHFCDICKCWMSGHKQSIRNHEVSKNHLEKKAIFLLEMRKRESDRKKEASLVVTELQSIEKAALEAAQKDAEFFGGKVPANLGSKTSIQLTLKAEADAKAKEDAEKPVKHEKKSNEQKTGANSIPVAAGKPKRKLWYTTDTLTDKNTVWIMSKDPSSGCDYYYNTVTKQSTWTKPPDFQPPPNPPSIPKTLKVPHAKSAGGKVALTPWGSANDDGGATDGAEKEGRKGIEGRAKQKNARATAQRGEKPNPYKNTSVWVVCTDPNSGTLYFYNRATRVSLWTRPPDFTLDLTKPPPPPPRKLKGAFIKSPRFDGSKPGFVFKAGRLGVGYYRDAPPARGATWKDPLDAFAGSGREDSSGVEAAGEQTGGEKSDGSSSSGDEDGSSSDSSDEDEQQKHADGVQAAAVPSQENTGGVGGDVSRARRSKWDVKPDGSSAAPPKSEPNQPSSPRLSAADVPIPFALQPKDITSSSSSSSSQATAGTSAIVTPWSANSFPLPSEPPPNVAPMPGRWEEVKVSESVFGAKEKAKQGVGEIKVKGEEQDEDEIEQFGRRQKTDGLAFDELPVDPMTMLRLEAEFGPVMNQDDLQAQAKPTFDKKSLHADATVGFAKRAVKAKPGGVRKAGP